MPEKSTNAAYVAAWQGSLRAGCRVGRWDGLPSYQQNQVKQLSRDRRRGLPADVIECQSTNRSRKDHPHELRYFRCGDRCAAHTGDAGGRRWHCSQPVLPDAGTADVAAADVRSHRHPLPPSSVRPTRGRGRSARHQPHAIHLSAHRPRRRPRTDDRPAHAASTPTRLDRCAVRASRQALHQSRLAAADITHLVTVSCTGFAGAGRGL